MTASSRGLVQILQVLLNLASHQDVEHDQQGDRQDDVEDGVDPEHVDIEVPVVDPDAVSHQGQFSMWTFRPAKNSWEGGVESGGRGQRVVDKEFWAGRRQLKELWQVERDGVEKDGDHEMT